jgi:hypothetical protein
VACILPVQPGGYRVGLPPRPGPERHNVRGLRQPRGGLRPDPARASRAGLKANRVAGHEESAVPLGFFRVLSSPPLSASVTTRSKASKCLWASLVDTLASWATLSMSSVLFTSGSFLPPSSAPLWRVWRDLLASSVCTGGGAACHPFISGEYGGTDPVGVYCGTCTTFSTSASGGRMGGEILPSRCGLPKTHHRRSSNAPSTRFGE